jgi:dynein heavy chain
METPEVVRIFQMLNLLTSMLSEYTEKRQEQIDLDLFEKCWTFCFAWSMGGLMENEDRMKFHKEVLERVNGNLPSISAQRQNFDKETVFDYYINPDTRQWENWKPSEWTAPKRLVFSQLLIPTPDSQRAEYIIDKIAALKEVRSEKRKEPAMLNTLLVGGPGTAKTSIIIMNSHRLDESKMAFKRINFSYYTQPINF